MVHVFAWWACPLLFHSIAVAVVFKHGLEQRERLGSVGNPTEQYADLMGDMMKDVAEITAKETLDHVSDEMKAEVEDENHKHTQVNDATNPIQWMKRLVKNVVGRTEDTLQQRVLQSAQKAFDQQVDQNGDLINPSEDLLHPQDPSQRREPHFPTADWSKAQSIPNSIPKEATGIFKPKEEKRPEGCVLCKPESYLQKSSDALAAGQEDMPLKDSPFQQRLSKDKGAKDAPLKDLMSDVAADLGEIAEVKAVDKVKDVVAKDYDANLEEKKEALKDAKGPFDWLKKLGGLAGATIKEKMHDKVVSKAQKVFDNQTTEDGTPREGTLISKITEIFKNPFRKRNRETTSENTSADSHQNGGEVLKGF